MKKKSKGLLYYIYCALGEKSHPHCNKTADRVATIRLLIALQLIITNFFIVANCIRHWNDLPSNLPKTEEERILYTNSNIYQNR